MSKKQWKRPTTPFVRGGDLLDGKFENIDIGFYGQIPRIIHQTWKSETMAPDLLYWFDGWKLNHPEALHVLWLDEDNERLVAKHFPQFLIQWNALDQIIMKTDIARLMYLYQFGGIYADLDYESFQNIIPFLPQTNGFMLVHSNVKLNEITQNSLMLSVPHHPVVLEILHSIAENIQLLYVEKNTTPYKFTDSLYISPYYTNLLSNDVTRPIMKHYLILHTTGPTGVDRALLRIAFTKKQLMHDVAILPTNPFLIGPVAQHHYNNSWNSTCYKNLIIISCIILIIIILIVAITSHYTTRNHYLKKNN